MKNGKMKPSTELLLQYYRLVFWWSAVRIWANVSHAERFFYLTDVTKILEYYVD